MLVLTKAYFFLADPGATYYSRTCRIQTLYVSFRDLQWQVSGISQYVLYLLVPRVCHMSLDCIVRETEKDQIIICAFSSDMQRRTLNDACYALFLMTF